jgi:hypothetical protein
MSSDTFDRSYDGEPDAAKLAFEADAVSMAAAGWYPVSQHYKPTPLSWRRRLILGLLELANIDLWPGEKLIVTYQRTGKLEVGPQRTAAATEADGANAALVPVAPSVPPGSASTARLLASVLIGLAVFVAVALVAAQLLEGTSPMYVEGRPPVSALIGLVAAVFVAGRLSGADSVTAWFMVGAYELVAFFVLGWVVIAVVLATSPPGG